MGKINKQPKGIKLSHKKIDGKLWEKISEYVRTRDCLKTSGFADSGLCYTCGVKYEYKKLQAGHFIPGRRGANKYDLHGIHAQCWACNSKTLKNGNFGKYYPHMISDYGEVEVKRLFDQAGNDYKISIPLLIELIDIVNGLLIAQRSFDKIKTIELEQDFIKVLQKGRL